jgi:rhamnogalacturonan endolyase
LSVADVDADGKDEIIYGSMAVDDDGVGLWNTKLGHGDALHVGDFDPARPGLEVYAIHEGGSQPGADLRSARTGQVHWKLPNEDVGRGVAADVSADHPGAEFWGASGGARNVAGNPVSVSVASTNFLAWWDGDLSRELVDKTVIQKANGTTLLTATGCASNNGTKATPNLTADLLGDWREEVAWRTTDSRELRIFTTTLPTTHRLYTLMHNPAYRLAVAWQNVAYNQPPHVDYFLGNGMTFPPPPPNIVVPPSTSAVRPSEAPAIGPGRMFRHGGGAAFRLPWGYAHDSQLITVRDAFGRIRARRHPRQGRLDLDRPLPEGVYFLQAQSPGL